MENNIFHIDWFTGFADVKIDTFFVEADFSKVKKLYKLARQYSTEEERLALLDALAQEDAKRKEMLDTIDAQLRKWENLLKNIHPEMPPIKLGWPEKQIGKDRKRLAKAIEILKEERWG